MIQTASTTGNKLVYSVKNKYVAEIRRYLQHKQVLSGISGYYKRANIAHSLATCNQAFTNVVNDASAYSLKKVCELVIINKEHLRNILPIQNNKSYANCLARINYIESYAKQFLSNQ